MTTNNVLTIAGQTDVGRHRKDNQDTFISKPLWSANDALLVVIDGVGGYAGGAVAADLAKESIVQYMTAPTGDTLTMLREAVVHANNQIINQKYNNPDLARMCCVLTAAVADTEARKLLFVHVGDTRLYRFREGRLTKLTHDHSLVGVREDANQLTEREAMKHPRRNEILRDIGSLAHRVDDPDFLESGETDFLPGDALLLCSDGLTDMLTRAEVTAVMSQNIPAEEQIVELIRQANEQGGQDNITVVLAHYPATAGTALAPSELPTEAEPVEDQEVRSVPAAPVLAPSDAAVHLVAKPAGATTLKPVSSGKWLMGLMLFVVVMLVGSLTWWQYASPRRVPANELQPMPVATDSTSATSVKSAGVVEGDSLIDLTIKNKPDSLQTP